MARLGTETAFEVAARARALEAQGRPIIHLEIGEPDFDTPTHVRQEAQRALDEGYTHYSNSTGILELRQAIAEYAGRNRGLKFDPANVVVTPGAKPIMFYAIMALVEEGEEVIYPNPGFPIYESMINFLGGTAADDLQLAPQPHRRRAHQGRPEGHCRVRGEARYHGAGRRDLQRDRVRGRAPHHP
jgi:aspartate/methionine/tyrosine aminotransferase